MMKLRTFLLRALLPGIFLMALSCGSQGAGAPQAVEAYLKALIGKDRTQAISLVCASYEAQAQTEYDSFSAVQASLKDLSCKETGKEGEYTLVTCGGAIVATYNGEDQEISLGDRTFQASQQGGDWRMCGYR